MSDKLEHAMKNARGWLASIEKMLAELNGDNSDDFSDPDRRQSNREDAEQTIRESVLSVIVRDGWREPGKATDEMPDEYEILLTTGGPALRIWGKINDHGEPGTAELQCQDWFTPWTRVPAPEATLLAFAQCFWFGE